MCIREKRETHIYREHSAMRKKSRHNIMDKFEQNKLIQFQVDLDKRFFCSTRFGKVFETQHLMGNCHIVTVRSRHWSLSLTSTSYTDLTPRISSWCHAVCKICDSFFHTKLPFDKGKKRGFPSPLKEQEDDDSASQPVDI